MSAARLVREKAAHAWSPDVVIEEEVGDDLLAVGIDGLSLEDGAGVGRAGAQGALSRARSDGERSSSPSASRAAV